MSAPLVNPTVLEQIQVNAEVEQLEEIAQNELINGGPNGQIQLDKSKLEQVEELETHLNFIQDAKNDTDQQQLQRQSAVT